MKEDFLILLKERILPYFKTGESHEFGHTERVLNNAVEIADSEGGDIDAIKIAALLHDIARIKEANNETTCHAEEGAKMAEEILKEFEDISEEKIKIITDAIRTHRLSKGLKAESKEAKILQDADRLDSLGAILIARAFSSAYLYNHPFYDEEGESVIKYIEERNKKVNPENFNTKKAQELAKARYDFAEQFIERFKKELKGKL